MSFSTSIQDPNTPIEVDETLATDEATVEKTWASMSASLSQGDPNFRIENGRRYHAYGSDVAKYLLPNDEPELKRLRLMHIVFTKSIGNKLYLAPLEESKVRRVLDLGTGTGGWALDFGKQFPGCEVTGVDLSPLQPPSTGNVKFQLGNVEEEWNYPAKFDFIMGRYLMNSFKDYKAVIQKAYDNVTPGGWVEFQDMQTELKSDDGSLRSDSPLMEWYRLIHQAVDAAGVVHSPGPHIEKWFKEIGFANVHHRCIKVPWGYWPKDPAMKDIGIYNLEVMLTGIEAFSMRPLCDMSGWKREDVLTLLDGIRSQLKDPKVHAYYDLHVVYGQKL